MDELFKFDTKKLVATGLGAALFTVLSIYVKVPTGVASTEIQTSYSVAAFFAVLFGPLVGGLVAFIGHMLSDAIQYGIWWSWVIASGVMCTLIGLGTYKLKVKEGQFNKKDMLSFNIAQIASNMIAWILVAPTLDIIIYKEPANLVYTQGIVACISNSISVGIITTALLAIYSKTRSKESSLTKNK